MTDATISPPRADATADAEDPDEDEGEETVASVHVHEDDGWTERQLEPGEAMEITLPDGSTAAVIEIDSDLGDDGSAD